MRPGLHPFENWAEAVLPTLEPDLSPVDQLDKLSKLAHSLCTQAPQVMRAALQQAHTPRLLFIIDQFEELYTTSPPADQTPWIEAVLAAQKENPALTVALTLRADFLTPTLAHHDLTQALQVGQYLLGPMSPADLRRIIEEPARTQGVTFDDGLVDTLVRDVGSALGRLPLLEFALTQLWFQQTQPRLTFASYTAIGRLEGALAAHADAIYTKYFKYDPRKDALVRSLFWQLVKPGDKTEDTRRLARRHDLGDARWEVAITLANERLVTTDRTPDGTDTVEVVHEALIRHWQRLQTWLDDERPFREWQDKLALKAAEWDKNKTPDLLLRGLPLEEAERYQTQRATDLTATQRAFIAASVAQRAQHQAAAARARTTRYATLTTIFALLLVLAWPSLTAIVGRVVFQPPALAWVAIPAGPFRMGTSPEDEATLATVCPDCVVGANEKPARTVTLPGYHINLHEITNAEYAQCVRATVCARPAGADFDQPAYANHPVVYVDWYNAQAFCRWAAPGGDLPTEAQWEKAARGTEGRLWPWGDTPPTCQVANVAQPSSAPDTVIRCFNTGTIPVGSYPDSLSPLGVADMAGNVWEWTRDWYRVQPPQATNDLVGPSTGEAKSVRGGGWGATVDYARSAYRNAGVPDNRNVNLGFRCVRSP